MSARALISGRLWKDPERRISGAGKVFGSASVRVGNGDAAAWWKVLTFSDSVTEELLSLKDGDAISATGEFKAEIYDGREGSRIGFTLFCDGVLGAKRKKRERKEETNPGSIDTAQKQLDDDLNDGVPF
jgi:hypothetical protein